MAKEADVESGKASAAPTPASMAAAGKAGGGDIESGGAAAGAADSPQLRWAFIRKVYSIVTFQILVTAALAAAVVLVRPIHSFLYSGSDASMALFVVFLISPFVVMIPMLCFRDRHPWNLVLLMLFTLSISFSVGVACTTSKGKAIMEAAVLTGVVFVGLTLYTFWAAKRGHDFSFLGPFLFAALLVLIVYCIMQMYFPLGKVGATIYGCIASLVFAGFIVYDTGNLIKKHSYDDYFVAAISLYLDIVNLFMALLTCARVSD